MLLLELAAENQKTIISTLQTASSYDLGGIAIAQSGAGGFFKETKKKMPNKICREPTAETDEKQRLPEAGNNYSKKIKTITKNCG
jgi:hypothetical protein